MKFSVFCGQPASIIAQADELYLREKDINTIFDLTEKYPKKDFVIQIKKENNIDFKEIGALNKTIDGTIYLALENIYLYEKCKEYEIPFFYAFPVTSFFELKALKNLGVSYIRPGIPIFFQMKEVLSFNIPLRLTPNKAYEEYIPRENGIAGQWIRPEDLDLYDSPNNICEFRIFDIPLDGGNPLIYEQTLLDIYKNQKRWNGRLNQIIKDIGIDNLNSTVNEYIGGQRLNCRQICQLDRCHYCELALKYDEILLKYKQNKGKDNDTNS